MKPLGLLISIYSLSTFYSLPAKALKEQDHLKVYKLIDKPDFYEIGEFKAKDNMILQYAQFGKKQGSKGPLIFINGRGENLIKYIELFWDMNQQGWSPIYTYDHRGQGFSRNSLARSQWGDIEDFSDFTRDLKSFVRFIKQQKGVPKPFFVIAHSMGALIAIDYVQTYGSRDFQALVLSAPMFGIKKNLLSAWVYSTSLYCSLTSCLKRNLEKKNPFSVLSYSRVREDFFRYLQKERYPKTKVVIPTASWIRESLKAGAKAMQAEQIKKVKLPVLVLQAKKDVVIKNNLAQAFCKSLPKSCELQVFDGKHELFIEKDAVRNAVIKSTEEFFLKHRAY